LGICDEYANHPDFYDGIAFVFAANDSITGIDLDDCLDDEGRLKPWAAPIVERFADTYMEASPSRKGLKIFGRATLPGKGKKRPIGDGQIEMYDQARFFTLTGDVFNGAPSEVEEHQAEIEELYRLVSKQNDSVTRGDRNSHETDGKILKGQRHNSLLSLAGSMRNRGMSSAAINAALQVENSTRCIPPYDSAHVRKIVEDAAKWKPGEPDSNLQISEWPEPLPLSRPAPDSIPPNCLPGWLGEMANGVSCALEVPFELSALLGTAVVSSCVASKAVISPEDGYAEPLNLYTTPAMESGNRKTATLNALLAPLLEFERFEIDRVEPERKRLLSQRRTLAGRIDRLRKKAAAVDDPYTLLVEISKLEGELPEVPPPPRLFVEDVTPERLASIMHEQNQRMAVFSDEGGIFDMLAGRYSRGVPNLDLWLKGHSVSPVRVDRQDISRPPIVMNHPHLTVGLSPQPDVLTALKDEPGFRGRGLLARFLYAVPQSRLGYRTLEPQAYVRSY
jgi:hypothetical protein